MDIGGKKVEISMNIDLVQDLRLAIMSVDEVKSDKLGLIRDNNVIGTFGIGRVDSDFLAVPNVYDDMRYKYRLVEDYLELYLNKANGYVLFSRESVQDEDEFAEFEMIDNFSYVIALDEIELEVLSSGSGYRDSLKLERTGGRDKFVLNLNTK